MTALLLQLVLQNAETAALGNPVLVRNISRQLGTNIRRGEISKFIHGLCVGMDVALMLCRNELTQKRFCINRSGSKPARVGDFEYMGCRTVRQCILFYCFDERLQTAGHRLLTDSPPATPGIQGGLVVDHRLSVGQQFRHLLVEINIASRCGAKLLGCLAKRFVAIR